MVVVVVFLAGLGEPLDWVDLVWDWDLNLELFVVLDVKIFSMSVLLFLLEKPSIPVHSASKILLIDSDILSSQCGATYASFICFFEHRLALAIFATVSVREQKLGGKETHPLGLVRGIPIKAGSPSLIEKSTANHIVSPDAIHNR